jgi:hypothetical protein
MLAVFSTSLLHPSLPWCNITLHGATSQKTIFILVALRTLISFSLCRLSSQHSFFPSPTAQSSVQFVVVCHVDRFFWTTVSSVLFFSLLCGIFHVLWPVMLVLKLWFLWCDVFSVKSTLLLIQQLPESSGGWIRNDKIHMRKNNRLLWYGMPCVILTL